MQQAEHLPAELKPGLPHLDLHRVVQDLTCQAFHSPWEGCAEHDSLAVGPDVADDAGDLQQGSGRVEHNKDYMIARRRPTTVGHGLHTKQYAMGTKHGICLICLS